jgi:uncharacterized protein involved in exopolysaccharide biosynthesis
MSFDSLTFARRLKSAGFTEAQAEALADANREMVVQDTATKDDIASVKTDIASVKTDIASVKTEIAVVEQKLHTEIAAVEQKLRTEIASSEQKLRTEIASLEQKFLTIIENQTLRLTVRLGVMLAAGLSIATALIKSH